MKRIEAVKEKESPIDERGMDGLLSDLKHEVPDEFTTRVVRMIDEPYLRSVTENGVGRALSWWQWSAIVGGGLIGVSQLARLVFGVWFTAAAW